MKRLLGRLIYANVMATVAVFLVLAGGFASVSASSVQAAPVIVGSPLTGPFSPTFAEPRSYLVAAYELAEAGAKVASPVNGTIINWHLTEAAGNGFELRVLHPSGTGTYSWTTHSSPVSPSASGVETFPTDLPIAEGDLVALYVPVGGTEGIEFPEGSEAISWEPALAEGTEATPENNLLVEYGFNAEVLPPPTISGISPVTGSTAGGTSVAIDGSNFIDVESVDFGSTAAKSYSVSGEGEISAVAPPGAAGQVPITVTTVAGSAKSTQDFAYETPVPVVQKSPAPIVPVASCLVPRLRGKRLKAAREVVRAAHCALGKNIREKGANNRNGKVVAQSQKPGTVGPVETVVRVTLGRS
jgi:hypothetical protein